MYIQPKLLKEIQTKAYVLNSITILEFLCFHSVREHV